MKKIIIICIIIIPTFVISCGITVVTLDYISMKSTVNSLVVIVKHLQTQQRPLIVVDSKYPYIAATKENVLLIENEEEQ